MAETPQWERLPSDTDKSFEAFCVYRDMGVNRSLRKVADTVYGKASANLRYVEEWSAAHHWHERVKAYDSHVASERAKRKERSRIRLEDNVLKDYNAMRKAIDKRLKLLADVDYRSEVYELQNLLGLMKQADDYARRSVGLPDKITEQKNEHTGKDGGKIEIDTTLRWEQLMQGNANDSETDEDPFA
jgi:hypothetical protein